MAVDNDKFSHTMKGYFVPLALPETEEDKLLLQKLRERGFVDLCTTRAFNAMTNGEYKRSARSAVTSIRNARPEEKSKRKEYLERPEVRDKIKKYHRDPEVKERRKRRYQVKKKLLASIPKETLIKVLQEEQQERMKVVDEGGTDVQDEENSQ